MPSDLSPIRPSGGTAGALVPVRAPGAGSGAGPARGASAAGAIAPVAPIGPGTTRPLSRSGVAPDAVLSREDVVAARVPTAPVELRVALEASRAALVRRDPVAALTALDRVWQGADQIEEGWYLRAGALAALGLAGEGATVASRGLDRAPRSRALRFVLSLSRALTGDLGGARDALQGALDEAPDDPVLLAQFAVLLERQGRSDDAARARRRLQQQWSAHPATLWAEDALRAARADRQRAQSRVVFEDASPAAGTSTDDARTGDGREQTARDAAIEAFAALGVALGVALGPHDDAQATVRVMAHARQLLRAFATDGAYGAGCAPSLAHAARTVLVTIIDAVQREDLRDDGDGVVDGAADHIRDVTLAIVHLLRVGRAPAGFSVRQGLTRVPMTTARWMAALLRDTPHAVPDTPTRTPPGGASSYVGANAGTGDATILISTMASASDDGVLTPLRLGLALLPETAVPRPRASGATWPAVSLRDGVDGVEGADAVEGAVSRDAVSEEVLASDRATRATVVQVAGSASAVAGAAVAWLAAGAWAGAALAVVAVVLAVPLLMGQSEPRRD